MGAPWAFFTLPLSPSPRRYYKREGGLSKAYPPM